MNREILNPAGMTGCLLALAFVSGCGIEDAATFGEQEQRESAREIVKDAVFHRTDDGEITAVKIIRGRHENPYEMIRVLPELPRLNSLIMINVPLDEEDLKHIGRLENLSMLSLVNARLKPEWLRALGGLDGITWLVLNDNDLGGGLHHLPDMPRVRHLQAAYANLNDDDLKVIGKMSHLENADLSHNAYGDQGLEHLSQLKNVTKLEIRHTNGTAEGMRHLAQMPLEKIELPVVREKIDDGWLEAMKDFDSLKHIAPADAGFISLFHNLAGTKITDEGLKYLPGHVIGLDLSGTAITDVGLEHLPAIGAETLERLHLSETAITGSGFSHLTKLADLRDLRLEGCRRLKPQTLDTLGEVPKLNRLILKGAKINGEHLEHLRLPQGFYSLNLQRTRLTDAEMKKLSLKNLQSIILRGTCVTDQTVADLKFAGVEVSGRDQEPRLEEQDVVRELWQAGVDLYFNDAGYVERANFDTSESITAEAIRQLPRLSQLEAIYMSYITIPSEAWQPLAELRNVDHLRLAASNVSDHDLVHVGKLKSIRRLDISRTNLTGDGFGHLDDLDQLAEIDAWKSPVTDEGLKQLPRLPALTELDLDDTEISDAGLEHLPDLPVLEDLDLEDTAVTDDGLPHLAKFQSLKTLKLPYRISDEALADLQRQLPNAKIARDTDCH